MVHLCFDEPNDNDLTLTAHSQSTTPLLNPRLSLKNISKTVQPRSVNTRSKTKRQNTSSGQQQSFKPIQQTIQKLNSLASSEISCEEEDDDDDELESTKVASSLKIKKKKRASLSNKLTFDQDDIKVAVSGHKTGRTPPHKKFRKLRLFDTPHTPKTLLIKSSDASNTKPVFDLQGVSPKSVKKSPAVLRTRLFEEDKFLNISANKVLNFDDTDDDQEGEMKGLFDIKKCPSTPSFKLMPKSQPKLIPLSHNSVFKPVSRLKSPHSPFTQQLQANINPFTPTNSFDNSKLTSASNAAQMVRLAAANLALSNATPGFNIKSIKRCHLQEDKPESIADNTEEALNSVPNKRLALRQCLVSRYHEEFHEVCKLGSGEFGDVFKCINRLDGCTYAIKRSKKPIAGSASEVNAWKEVCAHAVLVKHNHIVQYYSAWAEADRMLIQNEYCNGGSLAEFIESLKMNNLTETCSDDPTGSTKLLMSEFDLKTLLLHIAKGLAYMHSLNLVHLDIKPGNIFICRTPRRNQLKEKTEGVVINEESGIESDEIDEDDDSAPMPASSTKSLFSEVITYKIGDLGHVTSTLDPHVEEGDCRYLPNEILQEQYDHLVKADVFALALTVFVCGSLEELPKNGDEWHWIRKGNLKDLPQCSDRFKKLLTQMIDEEPTTRPTASTLVHHPCICPDANKTKAQLRKELNQEKFKNEMLQRKVQKYEQQINKLTDSPLACASTSSRPTNPPIVNDTPLGELTKTSNNATLSNKNQCTSLNHNSKFTRSLSSSIL